MTNCEHLIENALMRIKKTERFGGMNMYEAFHYEMNLPRNKEMLNQVSITKEELWEIVQYVMCVWDRE